MGLGLMGRGTWRLVLNLMASAGCLNTLLCYPCVHAHSLGLLLFLLGGGSRVRDSGWVGGSHEHQPFIQHIPWKLGRGCQALKAWVGGR